jgi:amino acid adenylation domain-containing protein
MLSVDGFESLTLNKTLSEMPNRRFMPPSLSLAVSTDDQSFRTSVAGDIYDSRPSPDLAPSSILVTNKRTYDATSAKLAPLTDSQREILLSARTSDEVSCSYNESITLKLYGDLDILALRAALNLVLSRHDGVRALFCCDVSFLTLANSFALELQFEDLSRLEETDCAGRFDRILSENARTPFDLCHGPLVRAQLVKVHAQEHYLLFTSHQVACDRSSVKVILNELFVIYTALRHGISCDLPKAFESCIYSEAQKRYLTNRQADVDEIYWSEQLKRPTWTIDLPLDRSRPFIKSNRGGTRRRQLPRASYEAIKRACTKSKCSLSAMLLAGLQILLTRLSGQGDVVVGVSSARNSSTEGLTPIGPLTVLPIRGKLNEDPSVLQFLAQVGQTLLDAYEHQNYRYRRLMRRLKLPREQSWMQLIEVGFNLESFETLLNSSGLDVKIEANSKVFVSQDLFLNVIDSNDTLTVSCDYKTALFDAETIDRWLNHYQTLLEGIAADADQEVSKLPMLSPAEIKRTAVEWNNTKADYPRLLCAHHLFEQQVQRTPEATAAVFHYEHISYKELDTLANQLANYLRVRKVAPGSLIAILMERSLNMLVALLGVMKAGCTYIPLDVIYPEERIAFVLEETEATVILTESTLKRSLSSWSGLRINVDADWAQIVSQELTVAVPATGNDSLAYIIYTSGSTGKPKGVEITHRAYVNLLHAMAENPGLERSDILLAVTTLAFDIANLELMLPLIVGAKVVIASRETAADGSALLAEIKRTGATVMQATPITWRQLLDAGWVGQPRLNMFCGGEALPNDLATRLVATGGSLWNMYGPTETTIWSASGRVMEDGKITIGRPIANTRFYILDQHGQLVPIGVLGELYIGGDGLARGYFKRPELTNEKFVANVISQSPEERLFRTGDLARYLSDGRVQCLGRRDGQIKVRGHRVELGEIESFLLEYEAVAEAAVSMSYDGSGTPQLVAYVVLRPEKKATESELRVAMRRVLPEYMVPSAFTILEHLPRMANGKVDRNSLVKRAAQQTSQNSAYVAPTTVEERLLCEIWSEVLPVPNIGIYDDVFALGADSLDIIKIAGRARRAGLTISAIQIFEQRTVAELAKRARWTRN